MRHKEKRRCSPTDFYSVGAERGRAWTEVRCAWSKMHRQGRDGVHQSCAAVPSAYLGLVAYAVILPGRLGVSDVDVFAVLCPLLFGWLSFSPLLGFLRVRPPCRCGRCSLWSSRPCWCSFSWLSRWFRGRPGRAGVLVSPVSASFVPGILSSRSTTFVFLPISTWLRILAVSTAFSELRGARQVERFAECSFRHLPPVVFFILAGSLGVFLIFAAPDPGGC